MSAAEEQDRIFMATVVAEVEEEARRLRLSGSIPATMERELDEAFERLVPEAVARLDSASLLRNADEAAFLDVGVPVASRLPAGRVVKTVLRSLMSWYMVYLVQQLSRFTAATVRGLHSLDERLSVVERESAVHRPPPLPEALRNTPGPDLGKWAAVVLEVTSARAGRVCQAECGTGSLVSALISGGVDAYGVEPRADLVDEAARSGVELRWETALEHLRHLAPQSLAGLVLSGAVDRLSLADQRQLVFLGARSLLPGGGLVLLGSDPESWGRSSEPATRIEADLAPGHPLHAETWAFLLGLEGLSTEVSAGEGSFAVIGRRS